MTWEIKSLPRFDKQFKRFYLKEQEIIREEIKKIQKDPLAGERKKGALSKVSVHKFKIHQQLYLLAYELDSKRKIIYLYALATHENFYADLQKYLH
ncbi:MAG: type II toxin-antitoxin system RelE/ParE family toxin [Elusimicrobiota bacterium]